MKNRHFMANLFFTLLVLASLNCQAQDTPTYSIPSKNNFHHGFGSQFPGDVLTLNVVADPTYVLLTAKVDNGSSSGWVGGPFYTAVIPANFAGAHVGLFSGTYSKIGGGGSGGGSGSTQPPPWLGGAQATIISIKSRTVKHAPDGTPDTRRDSGICEEIVFSTNPAVAVTWNISGGTPTTSTGSSFLWKAPENPSSINVTATIKAGGGTDHPPILRTGG